MAQRRQLDMFTKGRIVGILTITNRSVLNSECGPVCDIKTMADVSKKRRCYPTTSIRRLIHAGLYARRSAICIPLTSAHKRGHLNWSLKHQHRSVGEWANVMFSDESRFSLSSDSGWTTIWRERGTRFEPRNITERHHFPSRGVMVWAGIVMDGRTDLHFFDTGSVTAQRYRDEVFEPYVRLFRGAVDPDSIFMDDNAPCQRAVLIDDFLETENIQRMSWPANSPDLNHIEHVWDMLGRQIATLSHPPSFVTELKRASSARSLESFEPTTHSSSHNKLPELKGILLYGTKKKRTSNPLKNIALNTAKNAVFTAERYSVFAEEAIQFTVNGETF
ncbi:transposable element Tcb2 transposase [Trichonephila clavipes]|nr:transposable element Tcb2 transposase [Trichonephila clavipes]